MKPLQHFDMVSARCGELTALHTYLAGSVAAVVPLDELLRSEWVARVSALDLYVHELVAQGMVAIFEGARPPTPAYLKFRVTSESLNRIRSAATTTDAAAAFDLDVREQLGRVTYQFPDDIADGVRLCCGIELWNEVALKMGATPATKSAEAKLIKRTLSLIVQRRNKIAHEGDLQPLPPREPWPITKGDVHGIASFIDRVVRTIDALCS